MFRLLIGSKKIPSLLSAIGIALAAAAAVFAQYQIKSWTTDDGLPQNTVQSIAQTPDGYLWLATLDGLVRYDGVRFAVFNKNNSRGIESNRFTLIVIDAAGVLWAGNESGGVTRYSDGAFQTFTINEVSREPLWNLTVDRAGEIVVFSGRRILRWNGEKFYADGQIDGDVKRGRIFYDGNGVFWYAVVQTVRSVKDNQTTDFPLPVEPEDFITGIIEDADGRIVAGTSGAGLFVLENGRFRPFAANAELSNLHVTPRLTDRQGNLWASSDKGAVVVSPDGGVSRVTAKSGLSEDITISIFEDRESNVWVGTLYRGLNRIRPNSVDFYAVKDGLAADAVNPIFQARRGEIWIGGKGLTRFSDGKFNAVPAQENFPREITAISEDRRGRLWFGHWNGVYYLENGKDTNFTDKFSVPPPSVMDIYEDRAGAIWFATNKGLFRWQNEQMSRLTIAEGLPSDDVKAIHESADGTLWIGTYGGLAKIADCGLRIADCRIKIYTTADGIASNQVRSIYEDADGVLWIGSYDGGLTRLKSGKFTRFTSNDGLYNDGVFQILEDDNRNLWMSSNRGIYRVSKQQLNDFADGKISRVESIAYGKADGLLETECNGGQQPAGVKTRDGKLWFPTQRGVAVIDPAQIKVNPYAPPVVIESIKIDNEPLDSRQFAIRNPQSAIEIAPGKNNLEIAYTGLSFAKPEFVKFRYRLDGLHNDWVEAGDRRTAYYSYLPPGEYTFQVIAANSDGVWNTQGANVKVVVVPPFYRTWWFWVLSVCLIAGAAGLLYRRRIVNLEKKQAAQQFFSQQLIESQERERQRIAGELHDGLSQNLVIIKNRAMMSLSERGNEEYVFEQIEEIVEAAGESLAEVRVIANNLRPFQIDRLGLTKAIEALVRKANTPNLHVAAQLDNIDGVFAPAMEINLYRIVQESLNNIIKHSEATEAIVTINKTAAQIEVAVKDDGKGFNVNDARHNESANGSGFGITGIFERARMFGATPQIESSAGNGTIIRLKIGGSFG